MSRFKDMQAIENITNSAPMVTKQKEKNTKNIMLYKIDVELYEKVEKTGESFSSFARRAILKLAKDDGLL
jgi:hypothetical protein